jgi:hypothetical protein
MTVLLIAAVVVLVVRAVNALSRAGEKGDT